MSAHFTSSPQLMMLTGRIPGHIFYIPQGRTEIGRDPEAHARIDDDGVSRHHAELWRDGDQVTLTDHGSRNGTFINGQRLLGSARLADGARIRMGNTELHYSSKPIDTTTAMQTPDPPGSRRYGFGDVHGPIQLGNGRQNFVGRDQHVFHGHQFHANDNRVSVDANHEPIDELFQGRGFGRALMALSTCIALIGFGIWMYFIFSATGKGADGGFEDPFKRELIPGVPIAVAGFALFGGGAVLAAMGSAMSKASRKREQEREMRSSRRNYWGG